MVVVNPFILTIGLSLYFFRRYVPPRWVALTILVFALLAIPLTGAYRNIAKTGDWNQIQELRPRENLKNLVEKGKILELRNAAMMMEAAVQTRQYAYGTDYWNTLVFRFVPAQLIGRTFKDSLQLKLSKSKQELKSLYNYKMPNGSTPTGIGDAFVQFDYFGCLFFFIIAHLFKNLWNSSIYRNSIFSQIFYVSLVAPALLSVTHGTVRFLPDLLFRLIFIGGVIIYSQNKDLRNTSQMHLEEIIEE
jgi:hypothetical protein